MHPFKIGALDAYALLDGDNPVPNDNQTFGVGQTPAAVAAVLAAANQPTDTMALSIHPLLVKDGDRTVLIDAGAGSAMGDKAGKLMASLASAGIDPAAITDVLISHSHPDHVGGLVKADGTLAFPNATIRMSQAEWTYLKANTQMAALVAAITPKVQAFAPGAEVAPGIRSVALVGHTPGHTLYEITSGTEKLLYAGDTAHHFVVSLAHPEWAMGYDGDKAGGPVSARPNWQHSLPRASASISTTSPSRGSARCRRRPRATSGFPKPRRGLKPSVDSRRVRRHKPAFPASASWLNARRHYGRCVDRR